MSRRRSVPNTLEKLNDRTGEVFGLSFIFISVFVTVSLCSFDARDPHPYNVVSPGLGIQNYCGYLGSYIAGLMVFFFGALAYLVPFLMLFCGISLFSGKRFWLPRFKDLLYLLILLSACCIFYKTFEHDILFGEGITSGGVVGESLSFFLNLYLGNVGSWIILSAIFTISVCAASNFSFHNTFQSYVIRINSIFSFLGRVSFKFVFYRKFLEFLSKFRRKEKASSFSSEIYFNESRFLNFLKSSIKSFSLFLSSLNSFKSLYRRDPHVFANLDPPVFDEAVRPGKNFIPGPAFDKEESIQSTVHSIPLENEKNKNFEKLLKENSASIENIEEPRIDALPNEINLKGVDVDLGHGMNNDPSDLKDSVPEGDIPVNTEIDSSSVVRLDDVNFVDQEDSETFSEVVKKRLKKDRKYELPSLDFLTDAPSGGIIVNELLIREKSQSLEKA